MHTFFHQLVSSEIKFVRSYRIYREDVVAIDTQPLRLTNRQDYLIFRLSVGL
jgi:hypothetical protein